MPKWLPALIGVVLVIGLGWSSLHWYGKVSGLEAENVTLGKQFERERLKYQTLVEEYNALKKIQDEGELKKKASQEKTNEAKASHAKSGSPVYASKHDAGLLRQRSLEVRGEAAADTSKLD